MSYEKYSVAAMDAIAVDKEKLILLLKQLGDDVIAHLHNSLFEKMQEIVLSLNKVGHNLNLEPNVKPGEIGYSELGENYGTRFYLWCDLVVSPGYQGVASCDDITQAIANHTRKAG